MPCLCVVVSSGPDRYRQSAVETGVVLPQGCIQHGRSSRCRQSGVEVAAGARRLRKRSRDVADAGLVVVMAGVPQAGGCGWVDCRWKGRVGVCGFLTWKRDPG